MDLLINDLSVHGQFHDLRSFRDAFARLMAVREVARRFRRDVYSHRGLLSAKAMPDMPMRQVLRSLPQDERRAVMRWLDRGGPFWDDPRRHDPGDYLECRGEVVTDSAIGEAAHRQMHSHDCGLVSLTPSDWNYTPVDVTWRREAEGLEDRCAVLDNWWDADTLEDGLRDAPAPLSSWGDLQQVSASRFECLVFAEDCFQPLNGVPFASSAAESFLGLFEVLDRRVRAHATSVSSPEARRIQRDFFTGGNARFSDSSQTEKNQFRNKLTFRHPRDGTPLFCPWHGKVRHMTLRLHYDWSGSASDPVYVVYAGPKLTRR